MVCDKCKGIGRVDNPKYWNNKGSDYCLRFDPMIKCRKCKGFGYVVANIQDVMHELGQIQIELRNLVPKLAKRLDNVINIIKNNSDGKV